MLCLVGGFLLLWWGVSAPSVLAATYYVSSIQGSDANPGTSQTSPWKTAAKVNASSFQPGDRILFKRGDGWVEDPLIVPSSGAPEAPLVFGAYGEGPRPHMDGGGHVLSDLILIDGKSHIVIEEMEATRAVRDIVKVRTDAGPVSDVTLSTLLVHDNREQPFACIKVKDTANRSIRGVVIAGNETHHCAWNGITVEGDVSNVLIQGNTSHDNRNHNGIDVKSWNEFPYVSNVTIINNKSYNNQSGMFILKSRHVLIADNDVHDNEKGIEINDDCGECNGLFPVTDLTIRHNISARHQIRPISIKGAQRVTVLNNTLYDSGSEPLRSVGNSDVVSKNNLAYRNASGNVAFDPLFVNAAAADFRLCEGPGVPHPNCVSRSPAIDAGVEVGLPFNGRAPDLGALESGGALPVRGDLTGDGQVTLADLRLLIQMLLGQAAPSAEAKSLAAPLDQLTLADARTLVQVVGSP
jgi:hypothetical protein